MTPKGRGLVTRKDYVDGSHDDFTYYDDTGNLKTASETDSHGMVTYSATYQWDDANRLKKVTYSNGRSLEFFYDTNGPRTRMVDQTGYTIYYDYDEAGRLKDLRDNQGQTIVTYMYTPSGLLDNKVMGNGTRTEYRYDAAGQLLHLINRAPDGTVNSQFDYTYDDLGWRRSMTTAGVTWNYQYDLTGQLTGVTSSDGRNIVYRYDAAGNRISVTDNGVTTNYVTNSLNEYLTVGPASFAYDPDGNLISEQNGSQFANYTYDDQNRLVSATTPDGTWTYQYDPFGNRIASTHNGQTSQYLLDPTGLVNVFGEYNGAGNPIARYTYGYGLVSRIDVASVAAYYDFDAVGSTVGITALAGTYVNRYSYLPFGEQLASSETVANPFTYVGQWGVMNEANGLRFMRARFYSPTLGRFSEQDPIGIAGGPNLYSYTRNRPASSIDPSGLSEYDVVRCNYTITQNGFMGGLQPWAEPYLIPLVVLAGAVTAPFWLPDGAVVGVTTYLINNPEAYAFALGALGQLAQIYFGYQGGGGPSLNCYQNVPLYFRAFLVTILPEVEEIIALAFTIAEQIIAGDPNDIVGPAGYGDSGFLKPGVTMPYTVEFQNEPDASAPAQVVKITEQLDRNLDFSTFQLGDFGFGSLVVHVPAGLTYYSTRLDLRSTRGIFLDVVANFNVTTGLLTWVFTSLDPATLDVPWDPLLGFLPPDQHSPEGEGFISYTVRSKPSLNTGTQVHAQATVVFDANKPIDTANIFNTIDAAPPTSHVNPLPASSPPTFLVTWAGTDDPGGSGVAFFDIYVSDNGGPFTLWLSQTTRTQSAFTGVIGHTYGFYSVATDNVGNREATPTMAQATTVVNLSAVPTHIQIIPSGPAFTAGTPFTITVSILDDGGNPVTDYAGTITFGSSDPQAALPDDYTFTAADGGVHAFTVTLLTAGSEWIVAGDTAGNLVSGQSAVIPEFATPTPNSGPSGITLGPDGNIWFVEANTGKIGRIAADGTITEFALPAPGSRPLGITAGPDGNLWFTEFNANQIGMISPDGSVIMEFALPTLNSGPEGIVTGADGNVWFTEFLASQIGMISPDGTITEFPLLTPNRGPMGITVGPDGNLWFTEFLASQIGMISPDGSTILEFVLPTPNSEPVGIAAGSDGYLWFTEFNANQVGSISTDGSTIYEWPVPAVDSGPQGIITALGGNLWFVETNAGQIGQISPSAGTVAEFNEFSVPTAGSLPVGIAADRSGNLWFTESQAGAIGELFPVLTITAAPADHFVIVAPASVPAGMPFDITIMAVDPYGNIDTNYQGTIHFTSTDPAPGVVLPADYTFQPSDAGVVTFVGGATLITPGDQTITVTDVDTGLLTGSATVTVTTGPRPFYGHGRRSDRQGSSGVRVPLWAAPPRLPEVSAVDAGPIGAPRADEARSSEPAGNTAWDGLPWPSGRPRKAVPRGFARQLFGIEVDSFPIGLVGSEEASRPMALSRSAASLADDVWLDAFRGLWPPFESLLEMRRKDGDRA